MTTMAVRFVRALVWLVYAWVTITLVLLFLAFLLLLFGANPSSDFVEWVYRSVERAMAPFRGIFESVTLSDQSVLDISILFAMIVYGFVAAGLSMGVDWLTDKLRAHERQEAYDELIASQRSAASTATTATAASVAPQASHVVQMTGADGASASVVLTSTAGGTSIDVAGGGLAALRAHDVWLGVLGGGRVSAGTFESSSSGSVKLTFSTATSLTDCDMFGMTRLAVPGEAADVDVLVTRLR